MVSHPFRLQAGAQRIDQQLCYLDRLLQVWEDAADVGMVKPWPPVLHRMRSIRAIELVVRMESTRGVIEPGSSRAIPLVIRMECGAIESGGSRAIEPVCAGHRVGSGSAFGSSSQRCGWMGCCRAIEPVVRRGSNWAIESIVSGAIEPVVRIGCRWAIEPGVRMGCSRATEPVVRMGSVGPSSR